MGTLPSPVIGGAYVSEVSDFYEVATEEDLIQACDDLGTIDATDFAVGLAAEAQADIDRVIAVLDEVVLAAEAELDAYARSANYAIPLTPVDVNAVNIVIKLAWISLRARRKLIDAEQAERERNQLQNGDLRAISKGTMVLTSAKNTTAGGRNIYEINSQDRTFDREKMEQW